MSGAGLLETSKSRRQRLAQTARSSAFGDRVLERAFSGSAKALLIGALSSKKASKTELAELRKLLDEYAKEAK